MSTLPLQLPTQPRTNKEPLLPLNDEEDPATDTPDHQDGPTPLEHIEEPEPAPSEDQHVGLAKDLHATSRHVLLEMLEQGENLEYVEKPYFFKSQGPVLLGALVGTIIFIIIAIIDVTIISKIGWALLIIASFPIALVYSILSYFSHKKRFVAFTNKRVIIYLAKMHSIKYTEILELTTETNYLQCRKEIAIKKKNIDGPRPRVYYIDSIAKLPFYEQFLRGQTDVPPGKPVNIDK